MSIMEAIQEDMRKTYEYKAGYNACKHETECDVENALDELLSKAKLHAIDLEEGRMVKLSVLEDIVERLVRADV